jgi:hypothetical protein
MFNPAFSEMQGKQQLNVDMTPLMILQATFLLMQSKFPAS